jgi:hypothetical protein
MTIIYTKQTSKKKKLNSKQRELQDSWNQLIKKYEPKKPIKVICTSNTYKSEKTYIRETPNYPSLKSGHYDTFKKDAPVYTGNNVKGIGTLHKSNAVPIFSDQEAKDQANMRR